MKKILICLLFAMWMAVPKAEAQTVKLGYLAVDQVMALMPEMDSVRTVMINFEDQLNSQIKAKTDNIQTKLTAYQNLGDDVGADVKKEKEDELQSLNNDLVKFRSDAQQAVNEKESKLLAPLYEKLQEAINAVARQNRFTQIFKAEALLYNATAENIFELVAIYLGIEIPEQAKSSGN